MNLSFPWLLFLVGAGLSGLPLLLSFRRRELSPDDRLIGLHGGLAAGALAVMLLSFHPDSFVGNAELLAMVLIIATGAMMFGARRRARQLSRFLLLAHLAGCAGLLFAVLT